MIIVGEFKCIITTFFYCIFQILYIFWTKIDTNASINLIFIQFLNTKWLCDILTLETQLANLTILQFNCGCMITLCPFFSFLFLQICMSEIVRYPHGSTISNLSMYNFIFFKFNVKIKKKKSFPSDSELQKIIMICLYNIP